MIGSEESVVEDSYNVLNWLEERLYPRLENQPLGKWIKLGNFKDRVQLQIWGKPSSFMVHCKNVQSYMWNRSNVQSYIRKPLQSSVIIEEAAPMTLHPIPSEFLCFCTGSHARLFSLQITKYRFLGIILLSIISKFLRCASLKIAMQIFRHSTDRKKQKFGLLLARLGKVSLKFNVFKA